MVNRAVFLDRDGVINEPVVRDGLPFPPAGVADFRIMPGVREACFALKEAGYLLVVVTNQPDVGRGTQSGRTVEAIHRRMCEELPIDRVEMCCDPGGPGESSRRKPGPGMIQDAARALNIDLSSSFMVGDRWRDIDSGNAAGCTTILIDRQYNEPLRTQPTERSASLLAAARRIVGNPALARLKVKIFADGADVAGIAALQGNPLISGVTTNPTLMRKAGVRDYEAFARAVLEVVRDKPVSFETTSDDFAEMTRQAIRISEWGSNVWVKIPVTNSKGESSAGVIRELGRRGVRVNITAVMTLGQVRTTAEALWWETPAIVSVFAGRIADCGLDPVPMMLAARRILAGSPRAELLWASVREVRNIFDADEAGCDIVTVPHAILNRAIMLAGKAPSDVSLETVQMFAEDARAAELSL